MNKKIFLFLFFFLFSGINKINYKEFNYKELETVNFKIYFYEGGEILARFASYHLEVAFRKFKKIFNIKFDYKIPVLIYNSPNDFRQTNVILEALPEGVGGFTEIFKKRVVLPFNGSYSEFKHVLIHELVHVFEYELFFNRIERALSGGGPEIPLFIMEGLAEYLSQEEGSETRGFAKDLLLHNMFPTLQELKYYGGYIVYRVGELFFRFIDEEYGREKVSEFLRALKATGKLEKAIKKSFGMEISDFSDRFSWYLKEKLYPTLLQYEAPFKKAEKITDHTYTGGFMNVGVAISPDGSKLIFISDRTGFTDVYITHVSNPQKVKKIISGQKNPDLENLHLLRPGFDFSPSGDKVVFISSGGSNDILYIMDANSFNIIKKIPLRDFDAGYDPSFSINDEFIVFSGVKEGFSDLYILNWVTEDIFSLTHDRYDDRDPVFVDDSTLIFLSDRNRENLFGSYAVFRMNINSGKIERLTPYLGKIGKPFLYDQKIFFLYDEPEGVRNLYMYDTRKDSFYSVTRIPTYVKDVSYSKDLSSIAISILWKGGYNIFVLNDPLEYIRKVDRLREVEGEEWKEEDWSFKDASFYLTPDMVIAGLGYFPLYGYYGGVLMSFSDIPGNLRLFFFSELSQDLLNSNWSLELLYLKKRTDFYINFYQYFPYYILSESQDAIEKNLGFLIAVMHPVNIFNRFDLGFNFEYIERYTITYPNYYSYTIDFTTFISPEIFVHYIFDRSFRFWNGTKDGEKLFIGVEKGFSPDYEFIEIFLDFRKYFRLSPRTNLAFRFLWEFKEGDEKLREYFFGSPFNLRGYELFSYWGRERFFSSLELRIPFLDKLKLGFPPIEISNIRGVLFIDAGVIGDPEEIKKYKLIEKTDGFYRLKRLLMDIGFGMRINMGYFWIKLDFAKKFNMEKVYGNWVWWLTFGDDF